jgi:hypothetical protein
MLAASSAQGTEPISSMKFQNVLPQPGDLCSTQEESPSYRKALAMSDEEAEGQCAKESGPGLDLCRNVIQFMRDSAQEQAAQKAAFCRKIVLGHPSLDALNGGQAEALEGSAEQAKKMQEGNLGEISRHQGRRDKMRDMNDQMLRRKDALLRDRLELARLDDDTKAHRSVVPLEREGPGISKGPISEALYEDIRVSGPIPAPGYNPPVRPGVIDASTSGSRNLAEYERKIPELIRRQERMLKMMDDFESETKAKQARHEAAAIELGRHASALLLQAGKLGTVEEGGGMLATRPESGAPVAGAKPPVAQRAALAPEKSTGLSLANTGAVFGEGGARLPASLAPGKEAPREISEEAALLDSFQTRLMEDGKGKLGMPRGRLRDMLRLQALGRNGKSEGSSPGELWGEATMEEGGEGRTPASAENRPVDRRGIVRLDVGGAMAEIEAQLEELDRSMGILGSDSEDLFERVRSVHRRSEKSGTVGPAKS